jgi:C4-dicarboxylate-specific signal transduction histidine kinase
MQSFARNAENDPMESVTVKNVLDQTLVLCSERFRNHDIRLELDFPMEESYLHCRPTEIQQILINLVSNSFHAVENASERWVRLGVSVSAEKTEFSVTDSGAGIPPAIRAKIMQPFFTTKQAGKGTGLGLSISRAIAVQHKGDLFLDTQCKNTRFVLSLPTHFPAPEMKAA